MLELPDLIDDARFAGNADRLTHLDALNELLFEATRQRPRDDLLRAFDNRRVPAGPINTVKQAFEDPQILARELVLTMQRNGISIPGVRTPIRFSDADLDLSEPSPELDSGSTGWR